MLRRIPELFAFANVSTRLGVQIFDVPLQNYAAHSWYGGIERGERPAAILRTAGTDTVAHCLAFTTMHLVHRSCDSDVRGYGLIGTVEGERGASRLAGLFASKLVDRLTSGIDLDEERIGFAASDPELARTLTSYRAVAEIMYPDSREMRVGITNVDADPLPYWQRAIDHALFLNATPIHLDADPAILALVRIVEDTIESFYPYFLATSFGETIYERYGL